MFGSLRLSTVWEHAVQLYKDGYAPIVIVTGGTGKANADLRSLFQLKDRTEASFLKEQLLKSGVPGDSIIVEEKSSNTLENIVFGMDILKSKGITVGKFILVAKPFHMRRCLATFQKQFPEVSLICSPPITSFLESIDRPRDEFAKRLLAEVDRLRVYADKGDIREQIIPREVEEAMRNITNNFT